MNQISYKMKEHILSVFPNLIVNCIISRLPQRAEKLISYREYQKVRAFSPEKHGDDTSSTAAIRTSSALHQKELIIWNLSILKQKDHKNSEKEK